MCTCFEKIKDLKPLSAVPNCPQGTVLVTKNCNCLSVPAPWIASASTITLPNGSKVQCCYCSEEGNPTTILCFPNNSFPTSGNFSLIVYWGPNGEYWTGTGSIFVGGDGNTYLCLMTVVQTQPTGT